MTSLAAGAVLFIDEIDRVSPTIAEILYRATETFEVDIVIAEGKPSARTVTMRLEPFTLIGATTRTEFLASPHGSRFGIVHRLDLYATPDIAGDRPPVGTHTRCAH